jgi:hypothetical protein
MDHEQRIGTTAEDHFWRRALRAIFARVAWDQAEHFDMDEDDWLLLTALPISLAEMPFVRSSCRRKIQQATNDLTRPKYERVLAQCVRATKRNSVSQGAFIFPSFQNRPSQPCKGRNFAQNHYETISPQTLTGGARHLRDVLVDSSQCRNGYMDWRER